MLMLVGHHQAARGYRHLFPAIPSFSSLIPPTDMTWLTIHYSGRRYTAEQPALAGPLDPPLTPATRTRPGRLAPCCAYLPNLT